MSTKDRERLHAVIDARLAGIAASLPAPPPWNAAWLRLSPESTWEDRLLVCKGVRDSGSFPDEAGYFLMSWIVEDLAFDVEPERLDRLQSMNQWECRRALDRIFAELLDQHGEHEIAEQFRTDPLEHARRREVGREFFFGGRQRCPEDPAWLKAFMKALWPSLASGGPIPRLGIRYQEDHGYWEISVYPVDEEGDLDEGEGSVESRGFAWDIEELRSVFDSINRSGWYAVCSGGTESPYLWIEGDYQNHDVFLRLLPGKPDHIEPGEKSEIWSVK